MNTQQAVVEQIVQNLAFEVEAVPKSKSIQATSTSQSTSLNVKIRVRKKDELNVRHDDISIADDTTKALQKIRLVSSDQAIMTFDVLMETEFEKKPPRNLRKRISDMLRPGICLGAIDDEDDYPYMPSSSYSANITEPSVASKTDGTLKQTFMLSKNVYQDYTVSTQPERQKWFFGRCKPGGCLDPPFSEDKYSYKLSTRSGPEGIIPEPNVSSKEHDEDGLKCNVDSSKRPSTLHDEEVKNNERHSSKLDGRLFKKKRRSSGKSTNTKSHDKTDSILNLFQVEYAANSESTHSNSIITYPPKILSDLRISDDKTVWSRGTTEDKSRKSFNDQSEPYFIPPKGVKRIKEKDTLNQIDYPNHRNSDAMEFRNSLNESLKMPVSIFIPIPVPLTSNIREPEVITTNDISKTQGDNTNVTKLVPKRELEDKVNIEVTGTTPEYLQTESAPGYTDVPMESSELTTSVPCNVEQPTTINKINAKNLDETKLQPYTEIDKDHMKVTEQLNKQAETEPLKILVSVLDPLGFSHLNRATDNNTFNDFLQTSDMKITHLEQSLGMKPTPHIIKDTSFEESNDQNKVTSGESVSTANTLTPNLQYNNKEAESIPKNYPRTVSDFIDQKSGNENPLTKKPTTEGVTERDSKGDDITDEKPVKQNYIKHKDGTKAENYQEERSDVYKILDTDEIKASPSKDGRKESQRISQINPTDLQKSKSLLNGSKISTASIKDKTKRSDSADKRLFEMNDTYIVSDNKDENKKPLRSEPKNETDTRNGTISQLYSDKDNDTESTKPKYGDKIDTERSLTNDGSMNFITAPIIIDETEPSPNFGQLKPVYSEINLSDEPLAKDYKFDEDYVTNSTISRELLVIKSVIYDMDDYIPSTSSVKNTERTASSGERIILLDTDKSNPKIVSKSPRISGDGSSDDLRNTLTNKCNIISTSVLSSIPSTSTLKSTMNKNKISVEIGFQCYLNDKNERILRTFDVAKAPIRFPNDSVTVIKSQIRVSSSEIRIPVDSDHDMSIQIKKSHPNQRVSISESGFVNLIGNGRVIKQRSPVKCNDAEKRSSEAKERDDIVESDVTENNVLNLYEQELVPLQLIIKNLRDEIDGLAAQQLLFKNKTFCPNKSTLPRLVHSNKKCFGCVKKYAKK